jgi:adenylate cyclase
MSNSTEHRKLAAIMFTDMVGYSALAQRNEALALELLEEHRRVLRPIFPQFNGREVETAGDAFLVEFASALEATRCGVEIQRVLSERNQVHPAERHIRLRIGIHVGDVVHKDGKVMGDAVNIAARIEPLAQPGGICVSEDVARQIRNKLDHPLVTLGPGELKNIELPVVICRIALPWEEIEASRGERVASERGRKRVRSLALATVALFILAGGGWWLVHQFGAGTRQIKSTQTDGPTPPAATMTAVADQKSIAVLPFVNMSADKADEYLSDGMTEELLNSLAKVKGLQVPGRSSSFAFKGKNEEGIFRKVGEQLRVTTVLEGSVRKAGDKLRITAQLINVADGFLLWSETYDRDMTNIFAIQSDIARRVVDALKIQLAVDESQSIARKPTENLGAYQLYLRGRFELGGLSEESEKKALSYFAQAIILDPKYARAHAGLADAYVFMADWFMEPKEAFSRAKAAAEQAVDLDRTLPEAHTSLAFVRLHYDWDWKAAEGEFARAIALNEKNALAHALHAHVPVALGRFDEAVAECKRAVELDPLSAFLNTELASVLRFSRKHAQSVEQCQRVLQLDPRYSYALQVMGLAYSHLGRHADAAATLELATRQEPEHPVLVASLGYVYGVSDNKTGAQQMLDTLADLAKRKYVSRGLVAWVHAGLRDNDQAFEWLDKAFEQRSDMMIFLKFDPSWDNLRGDPRYKQMLLKVGFPQ